MDNVGGITKDQEGDTVKCNKAFHRKKHKSAGFLFAVCACGTVIDIFESVAHESPMLVLVFLLLIKKKFGCLPEYILHPFRSMISFDINNYRLRLCLWLEEGD